MIEQQKRMVTSLCWGAVVFGLMLANCSMVNAQQQVVTSVPFQTMGTNYFENNQIGFSFGGRDFFANVNPGGVLPPFAQGDVNSGVSGGFRQSFGNGVSGNLRFNFAQGSSRSMTSTTPSLTTMNGYPGSISSQTVRPFVTGIVPVVGGYPTMPDHVGTSQRIIANQVQAVSAANAQVHNKKLFDTIRRAENAQQQGEVRMARANYLNAIRMAGEPLRSELRQRMTAMLKQNRSGSSRAAKR